MAPVPHCNEYRVLRSKASRREIEASRQFPFPFLILAQGKFSHHHEAVARWKNKTPGHIQPGVLTCPVITIIGNYKPEDHFSICTKIVYTTPV
jgi:hypothetical protein